MNRLAIYRHHLGFNQDDNFVLDPQSISSEFSRMFRHLSSQLIDQQAFQSSELLNSISSQHKEAIYEQKARMDRILDERQIWANLSELDERISGTHATLQSVVDEMEVQQCQKFDIDLIVRRRWPCM